MNGDLWIWGFGDLPTNIGKLNGFRIKSRKYSLNFYTFLPFLSLVPPQAVVRTADIWGINFSLIQNMMHAEI
jgi:hypothetical protein